MKLLLFFVVAAVVVCNLTAAVKASRSRRLLYKLIKYPERGRGARDRKLQMKAISN